MDTHNEWTIQALNIHGHFFERKCRQVLAETDGWTIKTTNYPVVFPPENSSFGKEKNGELDIRAEHLKDTAKLTLLIECKKNNPGFTDWIFFPKYNNLLTPGITIVTGMRNKLVTPPNFGWTVVVSKDSVNTNYVMTNVAIETKGKYVSKEERDKTSETKKCIKRIL